ncbi:hypothetical protein ACVIWV_005009 [Bradyrhizobium diazoefficiens]
MPLRSPCHCRTGYPLIVNNAGAYGGNLRLLTPPATQIIDNLPLPYSTGRTGPVLKAERMSDIHTADAMTVRRDDPDDVVARLEEDIIFGRLAPGARLTEDALMSAYGTSRHFVR